MSHLRYLSTAAALVCCVPLLSHPAGAQSTLGLDVLNARRELSGQMWGAGHWTAFCVDEDGRDMNGDGDDRDTVLCLIDARTMAVTETGIAIEYGLSDDDESWPVATSPDLIAVAMSEADNGGKDLNGNGVATDDVLALYQPSTRQRTVLGVAGRNPVFNNGKLYFLQSEMASRKDLNGDTDGRDTVVSVYDPATKQTESLGSESDAGFEVEGDWLLARTNEVAQGNKDLNGDGDTQDEVARLYHIPTRKWTNTTLECSFDVALSSKLVIVGVDEKKQANKDLNGDGDITDVVAYIWDLAGAPDDIVSHITNTGQDCSGGVSADGGVAGFVTAEAAQANKDLNVDKDVDDDVAQCYLLASKKVVNIGRDASGGMVTGAEKVIFTCSEIGQGDADLNKDRDADDDVLMIYDPATGKVINVGCTVDGELACAEGTLAWRVLEADQFDRDLNRDADTDDSIVFVMDLAKGTFGSTSYAGGQYLRATARGAGFAVLEVDQGNRDLNMDKDLDDEIMHFARKK